MERCVFFSCFFFLVSLQLAHKQRACPPGCCWPWPSCSACWRTNRSVSLHWRNRWRTWCRTASSSGARLKTSPVTAPCPPLHLPVHSLKVSVRSDHMSDLHWLDTVVNVVFCWSYAAPRHSKVQHSESKSRKRERVSSCSPDSSDCASEASGSSEFSAASSEHRRKKHHKDKKRSKRGKDYSRKRGKIMSCLYKDGYI